MPECILRLAISAGGDIRTAEVDEGGRDVDMSTALRLLDKINIV